MTERKLTAEEMREVGRMRLRNGLRRTLKLIKLNAPDAVIAGELLIHCQAALGFMPEFREAVMRALTDHGRAYIGACVACGAEAGGGACPDLCEKCSAEATSWEFQANMGDENSD